MSASRFHPRKATRAQLKARVALDGPSGAGKTYTAIEWGSVLQGDGRTLVIDTEHGSAEWYSDRWDYDVITWAPPYDPGDLASTIREAGDTYEVVVIDSLSHFWEGEGGTLDIVDAAAQRSQGNSFAGWKVGTPALRHLMDTLLQAKCHVVATMRSKMEYVLEKDERTGKNVPRKVGLAPVMRQGVEYEFTLIGDLDLEHRLTITKSRCSALADVVVPAGRASEAASKFLDWLSAGEASIPPEVAEEIAKHLNDGGTAVRRAWLDRFGVKPADLPESRLDAAREFIAETANETASGSGSDPQGDVGTPGPDEEPKEET
jgi:hypothetical protein